MSCIGLRCPNFPKGDREEGYLGSNLEFGRQDAAPSGALAGSVSNLLVLATPCSTMAIDVLPINCFGESPKVVVRMLIRPKVEERSDDTTGLYGRAGSDPRGMLAAGL